MSSPRLLDQVRDRIRVKHYSLRTQDAYLYWIRRFIFFHAKKHPREMGGPQGEAFLSDLATAGKVAASTQNQALSALLFLYREVLQVDLPWMDGVVRAKRPKHVPVVLTENEVRALLAHLDGTRWLVVSLLYSSGARLLEGLRLRVKDVDFERHEITVRDGKGARDRVTMLLERLVEPLRSHLARVRVLHERDLAEGFGGASSVRAGAQVSEAGGMKASGVTMKSRSKEKFMGIIRTHLRLANDAKPELEEIDAEALVDTGALHLCIPEHVAMQLQLRTLETREVILADGKSYQAPYVSPVRIELLGRHSVCGALVLGNQVLLGSIPMEDMDLIVEPARLKVSVNPQAPNIPMSVATGSQSK